MLLKLLCTASDHLACSLFRVFLGNLLGCRGVPVAGDLR
jgi:hypothetical protein